MKKYDWKNVETGEVVEHDHYADPPKLPGEWKRVYSLGIGRVEGGASKGRQVRKK